MVNVDYIFKGRHRDHGVGLTGVEPGQSRRIESKDELIDLLDFVRRQDFQVSVGGSALTTICALAEMQLDFQLGFVGIEGMMPRHSKLGTGRPVFNLLSTCGVSCEQLYYYPDRTAGICVCEDNEQGRRLRTWPGANAQMADLLASDERHRVISYLERATIVHVSAVLDAHAAVSIIHLLAELKRRRNALRITLDPGYSWAHSPPPYFLTLLRLVDVIFVNRQEFCEMGGSDPGCTDTAVARQILGRCSPDAILVLKTGQGATVFRGSSGPPEQYSVHEDTVSVQTDVGAGDVFAAGFLAGELMTPYPSVARSTRLAHRVAVEHLRYGKRSWGDRLPSVAAAFTEEMTQKVTPNRKKPKGS